jgi:hypothetical protein
LSWDEISNISRYCVSKITSLCEVHFQKAMQTHAYFWKCFMLFIVFYFQFSQASLSLFSAIVSDVKMWRIRSIRSPNQMCETARIRKRNFLVILYECRSLVCVVYVDISS